MNSNNPLAGHFRQPALYMSLPSKGMFWPAGSLELPINGEIAIYPMTAKDEITLKTPDALLNGSSTVQVIESCVPSIKNAWHMPTVDLDSVLIAIRIASYGESLNFTSNCPECKETNEYEIDLRSINDSTIEVDWNMPIQSGDLQLFLKPQDYYNFNQGNIETFEEQKMLVLANQSDITEEQRFEQFTEIFHRLTNMTVKNIVSSIARVQLPDGTSVDNPEYIEEFIANADRKVYNAISERLQEIKSAVGTKPLDITCADCNNQYTAPLTLEQSNFFG
jgi:hypothetical protein